MDNFPEVIDLGALLLAGQSPFPMIEEKVRGLAVGEKVVFAAPFEPTPLYPHFEAWGATYTVETEDGGFRLVVEKAADGGPTVPEYIDLRRLPPPEPFTRTIEAYHALRPGQCLIAHLPHRPVHLLEHLETNGIAWEEQPQDDGSCQIFLLKEESSCV